MQYFSNQHFDIGQASAVFVKLNIFQISSCIVTSLTDYDQWEVNNKGEFS